MHDTPYFFNPDERNMASAITRFSLPPGIFNISSCIKTELFSKKLNRNKLQLLNKNNEIDECNLNPHFFAYGQFPLYLAYASDQITKPLASLVPKNQNIQTTDKLTTTFPQAVYWLRFYSAASSVATVLLIYLISLKFISPYFSLIAAALSAFTPGLIQTAHFGTTESILTFFFMLVILFSIKLYEKISPKYLFIIALAIGLSLGSKLTGIFFFFPPFLILLLRLSQSLKNKRKVAKEFLIYLTSGFFILLAALFIFIASSPYNLIEFDNFKSAVFGYESDVATGKYEAFYTRQFHNTIPFLFQAVKVFPYTLGWPLYIAGTVGLLLLLQKLFVKTSKKIKILYLLIIASFLFYLIPNSIIYVKWSRFMTPILPFFTIFSAFTIQQFYKQLINIPPQIQKSKLKYQNQILKLKYFKILAIILTFALYVLTLLPGTAFMSIYIQKDTRVIASEWIYENIEADSYVLSETANVIDIPLGLQNYDRKINPITVISFDFYHLNENPLLYRELIYHLEKADYIFIPSRRIFKNHMLQPEKFRLANKYYELLFSGKLGFEGVAEFASYPTIRLGIIEFPFPDEEAEETFTVFDHPVIRIYKKVNNLNQNQLQKLFAND